MKDKYKRVEKVPEGYTEDTYVDPDYPNRKYYKKVTAQASSGITHNRPKTVHRTIAKPATKRPVSVANSTLDRIYIEPSEPVTNTVTSAPTPVEAFMGDIVVDPSNHAVGRLLNRNRALGTGSGLVNTAQEDAEFMYIQPDVVGAPVDSARGKFTLNPLELQEIFGTGKTMKTDVSTYKKGKKMAMGGQIGVDLAMQAPGLINSIMSMLESDPSAYSSQPILNASTMRNMVTPYAMGGVVGEEAEVEGGEVIQTPDGQMQKVAGPSHEQGGVDMNLPQGTKVFSDRLTIDGKTMQQRKLSRERAAKKLAETFDKPYADGFAKNGLNRGTSILEMEEQQDMALQEMAAQIYAPPVEEGGEPEQFAYGGRVRPKPTDYLDYMAEQEQYNRTIKNRELYPETASTYNPNAVSRVQPMISPNAVGGLKPISVMNTSGTAIEPEDNDIGLGVGDYVGMAGTAFGAIAPIINTLNNRRATQPNVNRYLGYGHEALEDNAAAMDYASEIETDTLTDINTSTNAAYAKNRNGASSINTLRALDTATNMGSNQARGNARNSLAGQMIGLLGQRGDIEMRNDQFEAMGQTAADAANTADIDNYYSNMGANLSNLATGIQTIGRDLNVNKSNQIDANLLSQLSKYGLEFDKDGNLINKR